MTTSVRDVDNLIALGKRQDALYAEWSRLLSDLHKENAISLEIEKHRDDIVRSFACVRAAVATEIGRRMLSGEGEE